MKSDGDVAICMRLVAISDPMDAGQLVELKFRIPTCGRVAGGGDVLLRVDATTRPLYYLGDQYWLHLRASP